MFKKVNAQHAQQEAEKQVRIDDHMRDTLINIPLDELAATFQLTASKAKEAQEAAKNGVEMDRVYKLLLTA